MILNVEFVYRASTCGKGQRTPRDMQYVDSVPVEIREAAGAEAPVALRTRIRRSGTDEPPAVTEYRSFDGHLWSASPKDAEGGIERLEAMAVQVRTQPKGYGNLFGAQTAYHDTIKGRIEDDPGAYKVFWSERDARREEVRGSVTDILLVDGVLHTLAGEPVYAVTETSGGQCLLNVEPYRKPGKSEERYGRLLYRADEEATMRELHDFSWYGEGETNAIEALDHSVLRAPLPERSLAISSALVVEHLGGKVLEGDAALFAVYAELRDASRAFASDLERADAAGEPPPAGDALVPALEAAIDRLDAARDEGRTDFRVEWSREALKRMDDRQIDRIPDVGRFGA
jgi:hypothetical protein